MQVVNISEDLLAKILVSLPKGTPIFESFLKIAGSVQNASNGLNVGYYSCGNGLYANVENDDIYISENINGLGFSFKSIGNFIKRNVQSAARDTVKVVKLAAPLLSVAASFLPGGSVISNIVNKVVGVSDVAQTVDSVVNPQQQTAIQEVAQPQQNINQFGFPNTGTFTTPSQVPFVAQSLPIAYTPVGYKSYQPTQPAVTQEQVQALASLKNTDVESLKQELSDLKEKEASKSEVKQGFEITTPIAIGGVGVLGLIVYLATKK